MTTSRPRSDYARVAEAIRFLTDNRLDHPALDEAAAAVGLSPYHFQRLFTRWAGVSPKRFLGYLTVQHARDLLARDASVLDAALDVGLSGPSRLHDLFVSFEAMTPGEAKGGGAGLTIGVATIATPFGPAALMRTPRGICGLEFLEDGGSAEVLARKRWPGARLIATTDDGALGARLFGGLDDSRIGAPIALHVRGTNFQIKVWEALLAIPRGHATTYKRIAERVCDAKAARAVGGAVAANPVAVLIPCHRVIRESGVVDGYRWSTERKRALLGWEAARAEGALGASE